MAAQPEREFSEPPPLSIRRPVSRVLSPARRRMSDHSSRTILADRLTRPTRTGRGRTPVGSWKPPTSVPIRSCSRRGLPCRPCRQVRGALLPHPFTLTPEAGTLGRFAFCGAIPRVPGSLTLSPGGRYPPPCFRGARTFLQQVSPPAIAQPPDRKTPLAQVRGSGDKAR